MVLNHDSNFFLFLTLYESVEYCNNRGGAYMKELIIALISSTITIMITSFFNYHFMTMKESRSHSYQYKTDILKNIYTPLLKKMMMSVIPGEEYEGITPETLNEIDVILLKEYELVDPKLDEIIWSIKEKIRWNHYEDRIGLYDERKVLYKHVEYHFNYYRSQLGLPFDKKIIRKRYRS